MQIPWERTHKSIISSFKTENFAAIIVLFVDIKILIGAALILTCISFPHGNNSQWEKFFLARVCHIIKVEPVVMWFAHYAKIASQLSTAPGAFGFPKDECWKNMLAGDQHCY